MNRIYQGLAKWCFVVACVATFLAASTSGAFAATASSQVAQAGPDCLQNSIAARSSVAHSPALCGGGCIAVQKDFSQQVLGGYTLDVYLYLAYDDTTGSYCGWAQAEAAVWQPTNHKVGTLTATVCGGGCSSTSVTVTPSNSGRWWLTQRATSFPAANQCAIASADYLSLAISTRCILP